MNNISSFVGESFDISDMLAQDSDLSKLLEFALDLGIEVRGYYADTSTNWYYVETADFKGILIAIHLAFGCLIPIDSGNSKRKFFFAHELGHAQDSPLYCEDEECYALGYEHCFNKEIRAWINGFRVIEAIGLFKDGEREEYLTLAFSTIKSQTKSCISFRVRNLLDIQERLNAGKSQN